MEITVKYGAWSNISYKGMQTFEFDDQDWADATPEERRDMVNDEWNEWLTGDVSYDVIDEDKLKME